MRTRNWFVELLESVNLGLYQTFGGVLSVFLDAQEGRWIELAKVWVRDHSVHPPIKSVALFEYFWRDHSFPDVFRDVAGCIERDVRSPHGGGTEEVVPVDSWGTGNNTVKVVGIMIRGRYALSSPCRAAVVVGMVWM